jgi:hypothetical protein
MAGTRSSAFIEGAFNRSEQCAVRTRSGGASAARPRPPAAPAGEHPEAAEPRGGADSLGARLRQRVGNSGRRGPDEALDGVGGGDNPEESYCSSEPSLRLACDVVGFRAVRDHALPVVGRREAVCLGRLGSPARAWASAGQPRPSRSTNRPRSCAGRRATDTAAVRNCKSAALGPQQDRVCHMGRGVGRAVLLRRGWT